MGVNRMSRQAIFMLAKDFPLISGKSFAKRKLIAIRQPPASSGTGTSGTRGNSPQPAARKSTNSEPETGGLSSYG
jgi:hypothetical protein